MQNPTIQKEQKPWYKDKAYQGVAALILVALWLAFSGADAESITLEKIIAGISGLWVLFGRMFDRKKERE